MVEVEFGEFLKGNVNERGAFLYVMMGAETRFTLA